MEYPDKRNYCLRCLDHKEGVFIQLQNAESIVMIFMAFSGRHEQYTTFCSGTQTALSILKRLKNILLFFIAKAHYGNCGFEQDNAFTNSAKARKKIV